MRRTLVLLLASPLFGGCFSYTRVPIESATANQSVRLVVTREGASDLLGIVDANEVAPSFVGELTGREDSTLLVRVPLRASGSTTTSTIGQIVRVPESSVLSMERRDFSKPKTALVLTAAAGLGTLLLTRIIDAGGKKGKEGEEVDFSINIFSLPVR